MRNTVFFASPAYSLLYDRSHLHPRCILTRQLFENAICAAPISKMSGLSEYGIRISLQDENTPGSNDIVVFGRPHPSSSIMQLCVARILPKQRQGLSSFNSANTCVARPPRPDDPTPRKPPATIGIARIAVGIKRTASTKIISSASEEASGAKKKQKKENGEIGAFVQELGENARLGRRNSFKVPSIPPSKPAGADVAKDVEMANLPQQFEAENKAVSSELISPKSVF